MTYKGDASVLNKALATLYRIDNRYLRKAIRVILLRRKGAEGDLVKDPSLLP